MIRRLGVALVLLGLISLGIRALVLALASDATRIRWAIEAACEGFDSARMDPVLAVLAKDWRDQPSGFARDDLRGALAAVFFHEKDPRTKGFPYRCRIDRDELWIDVAAGEPARAKVSLVGRILDVRDAGAEAWTFEVEGRMEERDGEWCFVETTHETKSGSFRLRPR